MTEADDEAPLLPDEGPVVVADVNEPARIVDAIAAHGVRVERMRLAPADYVVAGVAIERKTVTDFQRSIEDKRLFEQVSRLRDAYPAPVALILEGDTSVFERRHNPRAWWGALLYVGLDLGVRILPTPSRDATAGVLAQLARRGVGRGGRAEVRHKPRLLTRSAHQKFCVQGLPGVGDVVSENLLERFGSVRGVFAARERDLLRAAGVGKLRAREIADFLDAPFEGRQGRLPPE